MEFLKAPAFGSRFSFPENQKFEIEDSIARVTGNICVQMAEQYDDAVVAEIANAARAAGVSDCFVMNKKAIIKALERQTPKKPMEDGWLYCPVCHRDILMDHFRFCPDCGQAIDWGNDDGSES